MSLNADKGKTVSDLEAVLIVAQRLIDAKLEKSPNGGIVFAKGKPNERRFKYSEAEFVLARLYDYFGANGMLSIGVCDTCTEFDRACHRNSFNSFGTCKLDHKTHHCYDSCSSHSKEGGGYGT